MQNPAFGLKVGRKFYGKNIMMFHKTIRIHRRDAAFLYAILESLEGVASYETLDSRRSGQPGSPHYRVVELNFAPGFAEDVEIVLHGMRKKFSIVEFTPEG